MESPLDFVALATLETLSLYHSLWTQNHVLGTQPRYELKSLCFSNKEILKSNHR